MDGSVLGQLQYTLYKLSRILYKRHERKESVSYGKRAMEVAQSLNDPTSYVRAATQVAQSLLWLGRVEETQVLISQALSLTWPDSKKPQTSLEADLLLKMAMAYDDRGRYLEALPYLEKAYDLLGGVCKEALEVEICSKLAKVW